MCTLVQLAHQCMREVRRAAIQAQKNCKETLPRARRLTKEMLLYWKKYEKVEKEHRKRAEKEARATQTGWGDAGGISKYALEMIFYWESLPKSFSWQFFLCVLSG